MCSNFTLVITENYINRKLIVKKCNLCMLEPIVTIVVQFAGWTNNRLFYSVQVYSNACEEMLLVEEDLEKKKWSSTNSK